VIGHLVEQALNEPPALRVTSDQLTVEVDGDLPHLKIDEALISKMVRQLAEAVADLGGPHSSVVVGLDTASDGSGDEVRITISGEGPAWSDDVVGELFNPFPSRSPTRPDGQLDRQLGLLSAFFIAHHHGGSLQVHPSAPHGPGFEVRLPVSAPTVEPANRVDLIERILLRYESVAGLGA
ncbi:MAG: ATP-binding protein, partial [Planctomycetota bacterium]